MQKKLQYNNFKFLFAKYQLFLEGSVSPLPHTLLHQQCEIISVEQLFQYGTSQSESVQKKQILNTLQPTPRKCHRYINCKRDKTP